MDKSHKNNVVIQPLEGPIDCACVIHGDAYSWDYVEKLYNMLNRNISPGIRMHVYTESHRHVPTPMLKHELEDWGLGQKQAWWYKMQLFNTQHHAGPLLYFDLDTIIVENIDWIWQLPLRYFWSVRDFKYLWRPTHYGVNSSIMWLDNRKFDHVWSEFKRTELQKILKSFHGDQDYITSVISEEKRRFFDTERVKSWRWQCLDGGYDFKKRCYQSPGTGAKVTSPASVLVFHGKPKPQQITDTIVLRHWQ